MEYKSIEEAKATDGLRLVLAAGGPSVWSEAAKGVFKVRQVDYMPVAQLIGQPNEELVAWTGHRNAPQAVYDSEPPRTTAPEIIGLAERLGSGPSLIPKEVDDRVAMFGLLHELAGENGFAWNARTLMFAGMVEVMGEEAVSGNPMLQEYRFSADQVPDALQQLRDSLQALSVQLESSNYFFGDAISALDVYWACFSLMIDPVPHEFSAMPDAMRGGFLAVGKAYVDAGHTVPANLIAARDHVFPTHLQWPMDF